MSTILAIESSTERASVAILSDDELIIRHTDGVQNHSQHILPMVQQVLQQAGMTLAQCDAIAFGSGPGAFTGVRTACGIAQGLAFGANLPIVPVVTLHAMAWSCYQATGATNIVAVLDARMNEVYWAQYRYTDHWQIVIPPTLSRADQVGAEGDAIACGNGLLVEAGAAAKNFAIDARHDAMPDANAVAHLAAIEFAEGRVLNARDAQPIYLRNKVALTTAERSAKVSA